MTGLVMMGFVPLIADFGDAIGILVFIVIALLSVAGQIWNKAKEGQENAGQPPRPRQQQGPGQQRGPGQQQGPLVNEVDQFVRQAAQRRDQTVRPAVAQRQGGQQGVNPRGPAAARQPIEAVPVELLEPLGDESDSVADHVRSHVAAKSVGTLDSRALESQVAQADEKLEKRVHAKFDHKLGRLGNTSGETARPADDSIPTTAAAGMAAMFANPGNIRQAIIMSEILQRPEHRWG